jgi:hypothetical protein
MERGRSSPAKDRHAKLVLQHPEGVLFAPFEVGEIEPDLFAAECGMDLEGLVWKHRERRYRARMCD